jgi:hypothetical protein
VVDMVDDVKLPADAVAKQGGDIAEPSKAILQQLQLLGTPAQLKKSRGFVHAFGSPPESVAVIEAGATALSKWWAAGLGAAVLGAWPAVARFWGDESDATQRVLVIGVSIGIAAAVLAIGYIVGSDVRGRSAAAVATIEARAKIADTITRLAKDLYEQPAPEQDEQFVALPGALSVRYRDMSGDVNEHGWKAIAMTRAGDKLRYLIVKDAAQHWVEQDRVVFP